MLQHVKKSLGFTLLELLIVFSLMAILSTVGIAAFSSYNQAQSLRVASLAIKTLLQRARSDSASQVNTCTGSSTFEGYAVQLCCSGLGCPSCAGGKNYEMDAVCSSSSGPVYSVVTNTPGTYPTGVTLNYTSTSPKTFQFIPLTGGVVSGGQIVLTGANNAQQTITVTKTGVIQ